MRLVKTPSFSSQLDVINFEHRLYITHIQNYDFHSKAFPSAIAFVHSPSSILVPSPTFFLVSHDVNYPVPPTAKGPIMVDHIDCGH